MSTDPNDFLMGAGIKSAKFSAVGDSITGFVFAPPELQQQRDINSGEPKVWKDGRPMMQLKVVLMTEEQDDEDDDGQRALYVKGNMQYAIAKAVRQAGAKGLEVGGKLRVTYTGDGVPPQRGMNPPKQYEALYRVPETAPATNEADELAQLAGQPSAAAAAAPASPPAAPKRQEIPF